MIYKWKHNYTDEEKGMALTIQNLKQEIDKLVDTNEDINREFSQYKYESKKEIERLNNIINELEKDIIEKINDIKNNYSQVNGNYFNMNYVLDTYEDVLNKLQELKGEDKE